VRGVNNVKKLQLLWLAAKFFWPVALCSVQALVRFSVQSGPRPCAGTVISGWTVCWRWTSLEHVTRLLKVTATSVSLLLLTLQRLRILRVRVYSMMPEFRKSFAFWKVPRLRPLSLS
jgi:hypothetical protein